jgi:dCTP deaminase
MRIDRNKSVLCDQDIIKEINLGNIILFDPNNDCTKNIQNCSVDITLGNFYFSNDNIIPVLNPWNETHIKNYWGNYKVANVVKTKEEVKLYGLNIGDEYILLNPNESILGHTREFIGGLNNITTMIKARSSMGRSNITICRDAGWGDIGFISRWTLEITNNNTCPLILPVGKRIGQIIFFYTGIPNKQYEGKYQTKNTPLINESSKIDIKSIVDNWNPNLMLPKAYNDL